MKARKGADNLAFWSKVAENWLDRLRSGDSRVMNDIITELKKHPSSGAAAFAAVQALRELSVDQATKLLRSVKDIPIVELLVAEYIRRYNIVPLFIPEQLLRKVLFTMALEEQLNDASMLLAVAHYRGGAGHRIRR